MHKVHILKSFLVISVVLFLPVDGHGYERDLDDEVNHLKAANEAVLLSEKELKQLRDQDDTSESEILEFDQFIGNLKQQVIEGCESVRLLGQDGNHYGVDCVKFENDPANKKNGNVADIKREVTREEQANALASELRKVESELDGMFLTEQEKMKAEQGFSESISSASSGSAGQGQETEGADSQGASGSGTEGQAQGEGSKSAKESNDSQQADTEGGSDQQSDSEDGKNRQEANNYGAGSSGGGVEGGTSDMRKEPPGDSRDDDVIARQLREAAEAETDEVLKEKLWEEYRKYKKNKR